MVDIPGFSPVSGAIPDMGQIGMGLDFTKALSGFSANSAPQAPSLGQQSGAGGWQNLGFGANLGTGQLAFSGLDSISKLFMGLQALNLANKQFDFQKNYATTNLNNQVQSYNTALGDRATARMVQENRPQGDADAYIAKNKLTTGSIG